MCSKLQRGRQGLVKVDILYCAWNRLEFTKVTFELLRRNTEWRHVEKLVVYDDGSEDGTREYLMEAGAEVPVPAYEVRHGGWHSTGATMNDFVALTESGALREDRQRHRYAT